MSNKDSAGCVCCCVFLPNIFVYIWLFLSNNNIFRESNDTNLTRRIDPRHPKPPYSPTLPNRPFTFFVFWVSGEGGSKEGWSRVGAGWEAVEGERGCQRIFSPTLLLNFQPPKVYPD